MSRYPIYIILLGICTSCSSAPSDIRSEIDSEEKLPPAKVYPDEKITITLWNPTSDEVDQISIEIEPDRSVYVRKYDVDWPTVHTNELDSAHLDQHEFDNLRASLSIYRPARLGVWRSFNVPKGCELTPHVRAIINVSFKNSEERTGGFIFPSDCVSPSGDRIEADLRNVLSKLSDLEGIDGYGWAEG
jgi:hypothetical protein